MKTFVTLRQVHDKLGSQLLTASLSANGAIVIEGRDYGDGVEEIMGEGNREYEWAWTVQPQDLPLLMSALGVEGDVLQAVANRFSGDAAAGLKMFLEERAIPHESWSRVGE